MLHQVVRPDKNIVYFGYDALGRRISKTYLGKATRWVWDGNVPLHEWELPSEDFTLPVDIRLEAKNLKVSLGLQDILITWIFEPESYTPIAKIEKGQELGIITDHIGTPNIVINEKGQKVWSVNNKSGKLKNVKGNENTFPFRYPGQYEDWETGLLYNRFRYFDPEVDSYIEQDPIGLAGDMPNAYAYVKDKNIGIDPLGLWGPLNWKGMGHHLMPREVASSLDIPKLANKKAISWYPNKPANFPNIHLDMHQSLKESGVPWHGSKYTGNLDDFMKKAKEAYKGYDAKGVLKFPGKRGRIIMRNVTPLEALEALESMIKNNNIPCK